MFLCYFIFIVTSPIGKKNSQKENIDILSLRFFFFFTEIIQFHSVLGSGNKWPTCSKLDQYCFFPILFFNDFINSEFVMWLSISRKSTAEELNLDTLWRSDVVVLVLCLLEPCRTLDQRSHLDHSKFHLINKADLGLMLSECVCIVRITLPSARRNYTRVWLIRKCILWGKTGIKTRWNHTLISFIILIRFSATRKTLRDPSQSVTPDILYSPYGGEKKVQKTRESQSFRSPNNGHAWSKKVFSDIFLRFPPVIFFLLLDFTSTQRRHRPPDTSPRWKGISFWWLSIRAERRRAKSR